MGWLCIHKSPTPTQLHLDLSWQPWIGPARQTSSTQHWLCWKQTCRSRYPPNTSESKIDLVDAHRTKSFQNIIFKHHKTKTRKKYRNSNQPRNKVPACMVQCGPVRGIGIFLDNGIIFGFILLGFILHRFILHRFTLHRFILHSFILHGFIRLGFIRIGFILSLLGLVLALCLGLHLCLPIWWSATLCNLKDEVKQKNILTFSPKTTK